MKYICAFLLLLGTSAHAWGTTCTLYGGLGGNTVIGTITNGQTIPACVTAVSGWDITTSGVNTVWTTTKYSASSPTTSYPSSGYRYFSGQTLPDGVTALYAVYGRTCTPSYYYTGNPYECYDLSLSPTTGSSYAAADEYCMIAPGTSITITAYPEDGKSVTSWTVLDGSANPISPTSTTATTFTFNMPSSDVEAEVVFSCPDFSSTHMTLDEVTHTWNTSTSQWDATISWEAVDGAQNYKVRLQYYDGSWKNSGDWQYTTNLYYTFTNLTADTKYRVGVQGGITACNAWTAGDITNEFTPHCDQPASTTVTTASITSTGVTVNWGSVTGATNYAVMITNEAKNVNVSGTVNKMPPTTTHTFTGLEPNTNYYAAVRITNACGANKDVLSTMFTTLQRYAVTYYKNDGGDENAVEYKDHGVNYTVSSDKFSRSGYTLSKWHTLAAGTGGTDYAKNATYTSNAALSLYAVWTPATYTVTLDQNGGSGGDGSVTATFGSAMPAATMPSTPPTGKTFDGYYYNSVKYYNSDGSSAHVWDVADDVTLVASWTTATPTLTIDEVDNIVISSTSPSRDEGQSTTVAYNTTVTLSHGEPASGYYWLDWNVYETGNESNTVTVTDNSFSMPAYDVTVSANLYTGLVFSCSELTLTPHLVTASTPIFITSVANKKVRSQDYIEITGSGLTPNTPLTFPGLDSKFEVLTSTGGTISTDVNGAVSENAYIFYTPAADATTDGLDQMAGLTVSVGGAKPKQASLVQSIIGRHLPADFVIAGKKNGKWYAMPSNMASTTNPKPSEIAVDDFNNPSVAYTATSNKYGLAAPTASNISGGNGQYIRLTMSIEDGNDPAGPAPLFGSATGTRTLGKSTNAKATSDLSAGWWWQLKQTNTSITNPQDAKYTIYCANNTSSLSLRDNAGNPDWGLFASGVEQLRLIPASSVVPTEAYFVEWGKNGGVLEVDAANAGGTGVAAAKVKAILNESESGLVNLSQTLTSMASAATKYNYTVNFGNDIDFSAAASNGAMLTLEWYNSSDVKIAVSNIVVPKIVASNVTINSTNFSNKSVWNIEVHVLPGDTLTVDASGYSPKKDVTIKELHIYPGAEVKIEHDTLKATTLILRNGWTRAGSKAYQMANVYITPSTGSLQATNTYMDWYIDFDQYYPVAVPWTVSTSTMTYMNTKKTVADGVKMRYYDGQHRANGGAVGTNWLLYDEDGKAYPATLSPGLGYAMTAKRPNGKAFSIVRMTMTIPNKTWTTNGEQGVVSETHKDQVAVTAYENNAGGESKEYLSGWNFIANPYMSLHLGALNYTDEGNIQYANIPDLAFKDFDQMPIATTKLKPYSGFFVQAPKTGTVTFGTANRRAKTPSYRVETQAETIPEQQAYIVLNGEASEDMMGLLVADKYTEAYESNADLQKLLTEGTSLKTYMHYGDLDMAYVAINATLAQEWIPVSVRVPATGEYTFSLHEASIAGELEGVYLIDYANDGQVTNLIENNYTFTMTEAGTVNGRFAINAIVGTRETPTDIDVISGGGDIHSDKPVKFIYREKVYIYCRGVIYDATGKKVR